MSSPPHRAARKIIIELTNRCNLSCDHCFSGRHGGHDDLPMPVFERVLDEAHGVDIRHLNYTGGDPTLHKQFGAIIRATASADYDYSLNTNGWNFGQIHPVLVETRARLRVITFSLDGATAATHDALRGAGSFRRVLQAASICVAYDLPFTLNMVVTAHNRHELAQGVDLATRLRASGLRFGHLMQAPLPAQLGMDLSPAARRVVEAEIVALSAAAAIPVLMAAGHHTEELFPCTPLHLDSCNIDCRGFLTTCCNLSGHEAGAGQADVIADLAQTSLTEAYAQLEEENRRFRAHKLAAQAAGELRDTDYFPCWYCFNHYRKVEWLYDAPEHPWHAALPARGEPIARRMEIVLEES